jgi:transposase
VLGVKNILARNLGARMKSNDIKKLKASEVRTLFPDKEMRLMVMSSVGIIQHLQEEIDEIETLIARKVKMRKEFAKLLTVPGVGEILGLTIMLEVGHIDRFPTVGDYSSYCRCIRSIRTSNGKVTGYGNSRNGNKYLAWAYIEAAHFAKRYHETIRSFYERKTAKTNKIVAIKAVSHKLARASYYVMRDGVDYDQTRFA